MTAEQRSTYLATTFRPMWF